MIQSRSRTSDNNRHFGFTLVELIVVIVVVGVLASLIAVGYGAYRKKAAEKITQADLMSAAHAMENARNWGSGYPAELPDAYHQGKSSTVTYRFGDDSSFCIDAVSSGSGDVSYYINSAKSAEPQVGTCPVQNGGVVTTLAGSGTAGYADGTGIAAQFNYPNSIAVDSGGTAYVAESNNQRIRKISASGVVTTLAGSGTAGYADGTGTSAQFNYPKSIAVDNSGTLYVTDRMNYRIRKISPSGVVTTLAGSDYGYADGSGTSAQFNQPYGITVDNSGTLYVTDRQRIRKISPSGVVTTLAGSDTAGYADGTGTSAQFRDPYGIAVNSSGTVFVADYNNHRIRKIALGGVVTTLAGSGAAGSADGADMSAQFSYPSDVAIGPDGTLFVADYNNHRIRKISPSGAVATLAGSGIAGYADGTGVAAQFNYPGSIAVDSSGTLYVTDSINHRIRKIR